MTYVMLWCELRSACNTNVIAGRDATAVSSQCVASLRSLAICSFALASFDCRTFISGLAFGRRRSLRPNDLTFVEGVLGAAQLSLAKGDDFVGVLAILVGVALEGDSVALDFFEGDSAASLRLIMRDLWPRCLSDWYMIFMR